MKKSQIAILLFTLFFNQMLAAQTEQANSSEIDLTTKTPKQIKTEQKQKRYDFELGTYAIAGINLASGDDLYAGDKMAGGGFYFNLKHKNPFIPRWHLSLLGSNTIWYAAYDLHIVADSALYWNLIPKSVDFVDFDFGLNLRGGTVSMFLTLMLYMDLDFNIPQTGWHFNFVTKNGLFPDFTNHEIKFSLAYEFDTPNFKPGIELGYMFWSRFPILFGYMSQLSNTAYLGLYAKW